MADEMQRDTRRDPHQHLTRSTTRREFLGNAVRLGAGAAGVAAFGRQMALPRSASARQPEHVQVLVDDVIESTHAQFAKGRARGAAIRQNAVAGKRGDVFTSGPVRLPFAATHLGLHWIINGHRPEAVGVDVRTSQDGHTWSGWQPVTIEAAADAQGGQEMFAALAPGQGGTFAQYCTTFQSDDASTLSQMTVTAINTDDGPPLSTSAASITSSTPSFNVADGSSITIVSREAWGCDESLRFRGKNERWPEMYVPAKKVVLHHTATSNTYVNGAAEVRAIYTYHARTLGWGDIGYNLLIDKSGVIYEGRHGRGESSTREIASADVVAGHVFGHNYGSTGIAAIGNSSASDWQSTPDMLEAIEEAVTFECGRHFIDPTGSSDFLKSDGTWHHGLEHCSGHLDSVATECPGTALYGHLGDLRQRVADRLKGGAPPALTGGPTGSNTLSFSWTPADQQYFYCLEGWHKPSNSEDITYLSGYEDQSAQYGDPLARAQLWILTSETSKVFSVPSPGHYTMHLRSNTGTNSDRYEANLTFLITETSVDAPPTVTLQQPSNGSAVSGTVTVTASASDDAGVSQVEFFANGASLGIGNVSGGSWSVTWDTTTVADGSCSLQAVATDTASQTASSSINVTVSNDASPPGDDGIHVGDLDHTSINNGSSWTAHVTVTVHDANHAPVSGATVSGTWSGGATGTDSGVTGSDGTCVIQKPGIAKKNGSATFRVSGVTHPTLTYDATANHDPDGDSDGTTITVPKP